MPHQPIGKRLVGVGVGGAEGADDGTDRLVLDHLGMGKRQVRWSFIGIKDLDGEAFPEGQSTRIGGFEVDAVGVLGFVIRGNLEPKLVAKNFEGGIVRGAGARSGKVTRPGSRVRTTQGKLGGNLRRSGDGRFVGATDHRSPGGGVAGEIGNPPKVPPPRNPDRILKVRNPDPAGTGGGVLAGVVKGGTQYSLGSAVEQKIRGHRRGIREGEGVVVVMMGIGRIQRSDGEVRGSVLDDGQGVRKEKIGGGLVGDEHGPVGGPVRVGGKGLVNLSFVPIRQGGGSAETEAEVGHRGNVPVTEVLIEGSSVLEGPVKRGQGRKVPFIQGLVEGGGSVEGVAHGGE